MNDEAPPVVSNGQHLKLMTETYANDQMHEKRATL